MMLFYQLQFIIVCSIVFNEKLLLFNKNFKNVQVSYMIKINKLFQSQTIDYAAAELKKYLEQMSLSHDIQLGLLSDFEIETSVENTELDDEIVISIHNGTGYIAGSNQRSVLIAVYRYLEYLGVRFIRPGSNGTYIPESSFLVDVEIKESASIRNRTVCIEGACSLENVLDMVEWLPKRGFNGYYVQFKDAFIFFDRWYSHRQSTVKQPEPISKETALEYVGIIKKEAKKRGLIYTAMGHGFTCDPFGVPGSSWDPIDTSNLPQIYVENCAMLGGKRQVNKDVPLATQMCYSKPEVRKIMVQGTVDYLKENPEVDIVAFYLADDFNNTCECEECTKLHFSDYYYMILNELDAALTENHINTRVKTACYCNLLHPPKKEKLNNPDRFIIGFAPISRTYCENLPDKYTITEIPPYKVNELVMPPTIDENLAYLYNYKKIQDLETYVFDYHLMWDFILDAGAESISKIIYDDVRNLKGIGINGFVSCQLQRNFFPTSLAMTVMGKTLWNTDADFEDIKRDLYISTFGKDADEKMLEYFSLLSDAFDIGSLRSQKPFDKEVLRSKLTKAIDSMNEIEAYIKERKVSADPVRREAWELLELHRRLYSLFGKSVLARMDHNWEEAEKTHGASAQTAWENEDKLQPVLDCFMYELVTRTRVQLEGKASFSGV